MGTGFDYWASERIPSFLRIYWIGSNIVFALAIVLAIILRCPAAFVVLGFLPHFVLFMFRFVNKPFVNLEENLMRIDPSLYQSLVVKSEQIRGVKIFTSEAKCRAGRLQSALLQRKKDRGVDRRIMAFKRNVTRVNNSQMLALSLWFLTSFLLVFISFFTG